MPDRHSSALRAVVEAPDRPLALLRSLVDEDLWVGLGWDPATQILMPDQAHPTLGHAVCEAAGCGLEAGAEAGCAAVARDCGHGQRCRTWKRSRP